MKSSSTLESSEDPPGETSKWAKRLDRELILLCLSTLATLLLLPTLRHWYHPGPLTLGESHAELWREFRHFPVQMLFFVLWVPYYLFAVVRLIRRVVGSL